MPDYTACTNKNERATVKAHHDILSMTRADIITMNVVLVNVFLSLLSFGVCTSYQQRCSNSPTSSSSSCSIGLLTNTAP
jgi:hypothetical protein